MIGERGRAGEKEDRLLAAAGAGDLEATQRALADGAYPDASGEDGTTPLIVAARHGHAEVAKALLEAGADPNAKEARGKTALMRAAFSGSLETVMALLDAGADPVAKAFSGRWRAITRSSGIIRRALRASRSSRGGRSTGLRSERRRPRKKAGGSDARRIKRERA